MFLVRNLKFKNILDIPFLSIDRKVTCIVGPSGSGKTTLLRMLNRLSIPDEGTIFYKGEDLAYIDTIKLRRNVVMLGQSPVIYDGTVEDNLQIGLKFSKRPLATAAEMNEILSRVELNKPLTSLCNMFSGGEKQRLCLARVMLMNAETYLLDEPSAALDNHTERFIMDNLTDFAITKNKRLILITHSEQISQTFSDAIIRIEKGHVVEANNE